MIPSGAVDSHGLGAGFTVGVIYQKLQRARGAATPGDSRVQDPWRQERGWLFREAAG